MKKWFLIVCALVLASCGKSLSGTYVMTGGGGFGDSSLTFKSGGKVVQAALGVEIEMSYVIEDEKVQGYLLAHKHPVSTGRSCQEQGGNNHS